MSVPGLGGGAYRSFFLTTDSGVVLFDPLLGNTVAGSVVAEANKVSGGALLKAVIVSHFHADHAGGIGAILSTGATIFAPSGSEAVIARYAAASTGQDAASLIKRIVGIAPGESVLLNARRGLRVINLGRTPHVDGVLALEDSVSQAIVNADMYSPLSPFNETFAWFVDWVTGRKKQWDLIVGTHHEPIRLDSLRALRATYRAGRAPGAPPGDAERPRAKHGGPGAHP